MYTKQIYEAYTPSIYTKHKYLAYIPSPTARFRLDVPGVWRWISENLSRPTVVLDIWEPVPTDCGSTRSPPRGRYVEQ